MARDEEEAALKAEIADRQRQRMVHAGEFGLEVGRRFGAGFTGATPEQVRAGARPGFERPLTQQQRLAMQRDLTAIVASLDKIDELRTREKSTSRREMGRYFVQLSGQWGDILRQEIATSGTLGSAKLEAQAMTYSTQMELVDQKMKIAGWDYNQTRFERQRGLTHEIAKDFETLIRETDKMLEIAKTNPITGERETFRTRGYELAPVTIAGEPQTDWMGLNKVLRENLLDKSAEEAAYWVAEVESRFPGVHLDEILATGSKTQNWVQSSALQDQFNEATKVIAQRQAIDQQAIQERMMLTDQMASLGARGGASETTIAAFRQSQETAMTVMSSPRFQYGHNWDPMPAPDAPPLERNEWLASEWGAKIDEGGNLVDVEEGYPILSADGVTPLTYEGAYASEEQTRQQMVVTPGADAEVTRGREVSQIGEFATQARDQVDIMWKEILQGKKPTIFQDMSNLFDPSTDQGASEDGIKAQKWAADRGYAIASARDRDWTTRQLIRETRFKRRSDRQDRRRQLRENIASGDAEANPLRRLRAQAGQAMFGREDDAEEAEELGREVDGGRDGADITAGAEEGGSPPKGGTVTESDAGEAGQAKAASMSRDPEAVAREESDLLQEALEPLRIDRETGDPEIGLMPGETGEEVPGEAPLEDEPLPPPSDVGFATPVPAEPIWEDISDEAYTRDQQSANDKLLQHALNSGLVNQEQAIQWRLEMKENEVPPDEFAEALLALSFGKRIGLEPQVESDIRSQIPDGGGPSWSQESLEEKEPITGGELGVEERAPLSAMDREALQIEEDAEKGMTALARPDPEGSFTKLTAPEHIQEQWKKEWGWILGQKAERERREQEAAILKEIALAEAEGRDPTLFPGDVLTPKERWYAREIRKPEGKLAVDRPAIESTAGEEAAAREVEQESRQPQDFSELAGRQARVGERRAGRGIGNEEARRNLIMKQLEEEEEVEKIRQRPIRERKSGERIMRALDMPTKDIGEAF